MAQNINNQPPDTLDVLPDNAVFVDPEQGSEEQSSPQPASSQPTLQGNVSVWNKIKDGWQNGVEVSEPVDKFFDWYDGTPVGKYLNQNGGDDLPYFMPTTALATPFAEAIMPVEELFINPYTTKALKPIGDALHNGYNSIKGMAGNSEKYITNAFDNLGNGLMNMLSPTKKSEAPIGLNGLRTEPAPIPTPSTGYRGLGVGQAEKAGTGYQPNFRLRGNEVAPTNLRLPAVKPEPTGFKMGGGSNLYGQPARNNTVSGLLQDNLSNYKGAGIGHVDNFSTPYQPNFRLYGNEIVPRNPNLPDTIPQPTGFEMGNGSSLYGQPNRPIAGLLPDNLSAYRNTGTGKVGQWSDLSPNTGFTMQPNIAGLLTDRGNPNGINAEELLRNYVQNGGKITPESTTLAGKLSPSQVQAFENYFGQVFQGNPGQLNLFQGLR